MRPYQEFEEISSDPESVDGNDSSDEEYVPGSRQEDTSESDQDYVCQVRNSSSKVYGCNKNDRVDDVSFGDEVVNSSASP